MADGYYECIVKPRKPMVPLKTLDIIFRRRHVPNTQYYITNRKHAVPEGALPRKRIRPFMVPKSEKLLSYIKYSDRKEKAITKQRVLKPLHLKDNVKIAATRDMSQRMFIPEPKDDVRAVVEIHPEFYTVIEGRPLRSFDDIKVYYMNIRNYAMLKQQIGYRRDLILKINKSMIEESKICDKIYDNLRTHIKDFQRFLTEDYKKAQAKVDKAEKVLEDLQAKNSELLGYVTQMTIINNMLFKLDSIRSVLKTYRSYLLFAAPIYWRQDFDESFRCKSLELEQGGFVAGSGHFATDNDLVDTMDIDKIVEEAKIELMTPVPAFMYFHYPEEMAYLFRTMELQSREYLIQLSKTHGPYKQLQDRIKKLKLSTKQEIDMSEYFVHSLTKQIERETYNETYLQEKFLRILNESFYDTVASPSTLKLKICIEYVYEQIFGKCDEGHQNLHDPMKILEVMYEEYNLKLDSLDFKIVNQARADFFAQDLKMMRDAYYAQRSLREFREMTNAMNKAFLPPAKFKRPVIGKYLDKKAIVALGLAEKKKGEMASGERIKRKQYKVSEEYREDLLLFTEWCDGLNPAPYIKEIIKYVKPTFAISSDDDQRV